MSQPGAPADLDVTVLDRGRTRQFTVPTPRGGAGLADTIVDAGRRRPQSGPADWPDDGLPDPLAARYELIRRLDPPSSQGEMYLVRVRGDGSQAVLKRHQRPRDPHPGLAAYLGVSHGHVVRHLELAPGYTVTAYVAGRTLREESVARPSGLGFAQLHAVVQQVSAALIGLHRAGFVHRDVKPANIMIRSDPSVDVTLVDFGISGPLDGTEWPDDPNPAYQPPEWSNLGQVGAATDWWGLGMTLLELAAGEHPFEGLAPADIRRHFGSSRSVDVSGVPDDPSADKSERRHRLRDLCQGLLVPDPAERWGAQEVGRWLVGQDPDLPSAAASRSAPAASTAVAAETPYRFRGTAYYLRNELAQAMTMAWNHAQHVLFERAGGLDDLRGWLDQFPDDDGAHARDVVDGLDGSQPIGVRLLQVLRALDPTRPPVYRNHVISRRGLLTIAHRALVNEGDDALVLADLWNHRLLSDFDTAAPVDADAGGEGLADVDRAWQGARRAWDDLVDQVTDPQARQHLREVVTDRERLAVCLRVALRRPEDLTAAQDLLDRAVADLPVPVPWFERLVRDPAMIWAALLLAGHAASRARTEADRDRIIGNHQEFLRMSASFREWSRRQNRPVALGWAVAGVCLFAVVWITFIAAADAVNWAGDTAVGLAWVGASICLLVSLVAESLLAVEIGGRFHVRYSIPGAGVIALRPLGRWMQRAWLSAAGVILVLLAVTTLSALRYPQFVAVATTTAHLIWVVRRWRAWRVVVDVENRHIAQAERIAQAEPSRPSDTDAVPVGAVGGADT
ncbi:protein kinase domain-containing protein [Solwaraspora sp. WMMB335]|uniref:protein kinase domain-containing protein n=1 Tax=Solwaraspora sp. WMMB335 TaxID=3404118 RepID=UPI003B96617C